MDTEMTASHGQTGVRSIDLVAPILVAAGTR